MSKTMSPLQCPVCGTRFADGFVSYGSGAVWHSEKPRGLGRLFWSAFTRGAAVFGSVLSSPVVSSVSAHRCPGCSGVFIPGPSTR